MMPKNRGFATTALLYTCLYAAAVVADHITTNMAVAAGAIETNLLFQAQGGALEQGRAAWVFVLIWPVMLGLLWLADARRNGAAGEPGWLAAQLIGRKPSSAALFPLVVVIAKSFAAASNLLIALYGFSVFRPLRYLLTVAGTNSVPIRFLAGGLVVLVPAIWLSRALARWWYGQASPDAASSAR